MNLNVIADLYIDLTAGGGIVGSHLFLGSALVIIVALTRPKHPAAPKPPWEFRLMRRTRTAGGIPGAATEYFELSRAHRNSEQKVRLKCEWGVGQAMQCSQQGAGLSEAQAAHRRNCWLDRGSEPGRAPVGGVAQVV